LNAPADTRPLGYVELLRRNPNFRRLWLGQVVSQIGDWLDYVALLTLLLHLTGSATVVAGMLVARFLPTVVASPLAGVVVDRIDRKRVMVAADLCRAVAVLGLLVIERPDQVWISYAVVATVVSLTAFFEPARSASIPNVTTQEELIVANTLGAITWSVSLGLGSAIGGLVTALAGWRAAIALDALSFLASAWLISGIVLPQRERIARQHLSWRAALGVDDLIEGVRYLRSRPPVAATVLVKSGWALAGGVILLHSIFGERIYPVWGRAAAGIGFLAMARGVGTAIGPVAARRLFGGSPVRMAQAIAVGFFLAGSLYVVFATVHSLPAALFVLAVAHMGGSTVWVFSTTLLQLAVPDGLRGRVFAAELALLTLSMTVSNVCTGWALDRMGLDPRTLAAMLGALCFLPGTTWVLVQRSRWRIT